MKLPYTGLQRCQRPGRPLFGALRPLEWLLGLGGATIMENMFLYWGPGHLLVVRRIGFRERYQRLYFEDIQGLRIEQTRQHHVATLLLVAFGLLALLALSSSVSSASLASSTFPFISVGLLLVLFTLIGANLYLGPACTCTVYTPVERVRLHGISRWRAALAFSGEIARRAQEAQADLPVASMEASLAMHPARIPLPAHVGDLTLRWHVITYVALIATALHVALMQGMTAVYGGAPPAGLMALGWLLVPVYVWGAAMSIGHQSHPAFPRELARFNNVFTLLVLFPALVISYFRLPTLAGPSGAFLEAVEAVSVFHVSASAAGALAGLMVLLSVRPRAR